MPTVEERVAFLEGQVSEHTHVFVELRESVRHLEHRMDVGFEAVDRRFESVNTRIDALDHKISRQFVWLVGMMMTLLIAVAGALLARA